MEQNKDPDGEGWGPQAGGSWDTARRRTFSKVPRLSKQGPSGSLMLCSFLPKSRLLICEMGWLRSILSILGMKSTPRDQKEQKESLWGPGALLSQWRCRKIKEPPEQMCPHSRGSRGRRGRWPATGHPRDPAGEEAQASPLVQKETEKLNADGGLTAQSERRVRIRLGLEGAQEGESCGHVGKDQGNLVLSEGADGARRLSPANLAGREGQEPQPTT